jgi:hypothetical protein
LWGLSAIINAMVKLQFVIVAVTSAFEGADLPLFTWAKFYTLVKRPTIIIYGPLVSANTNLLCSHITIVMFTVFLNDVFSSINASDQWIRKFHVVWFEITN